MLHREINLASIQSKIIKSLFLLNRRLFFKRSRSIDELRVDMHGLSSFLTYPSEVKREKLSIGGVACERYTPKGAPESKALFYLHGGAYVNGPLSIYGPYISRFAKHCGVKCVLVDYGLAPEHPFPAAVDDAVKVYRSLIDSGIQPKAILIAGDSAGGGLAIATLVALRDQGMPLPKGCLVISPWADLTDSSPSHQSKAAVDVMLTTERLNISAQVYVGEADLKNPLISPVFADLRGLPPLFIQVGTDEILLDDSLTLAANAEKAGVMVTLKVWEGMFHVWHAMQHVMPEGREAVQEAITFIQSQLEI